MVVSGFVLKTENDELQVLSQEGDGPFVVGLGCRFGDIQFFGDGRKGFVFYGVF